LALQGVLEEQAPDQVHVDEKVAQGIAAAHLLHADYLASDIAAELEVNGHLAALGERALLADEDDVEDSLLVIVADLNVQFLASEQLPLAVHETLNHSDLVSVGHGEVSQLLIITRRQIERQVIEYEDLLLERLFTRLLLLSWRLYLLHLLLGLLFLQEVYEGVFEYVVSPIFLRGLQGQGRGIWLLSLLTLHDG